MEAALDALEYRALLDSGDDAAERGLHRWADAESAMVRAVDDTCEINETKWAGISTFWR